MRLEITRLKAYEHNPRRGENPEYDRIKASIRTDGMDQPLVVTRRPGESDYVVGAGGNTRLHILRALYQETGEDRFYWVDCLFKPWRQESSLLLAHLRENDLRGPLSFIDKARAVFEAKRLLEQEMGGDNLSQRQLATLLRDRGYSLSHGLISQMGYAVHTLLPVIPQALQSGLGRPQVERIRALERAARQIWKQRDLGDDQSFDGVFATLCGRYDGIEWDLDSLRSAIETEIAEALELSIHAIRVELDAHLLGSVIDVPVPDPAPDPVPVAVSPNEVDTSTGASAVDPGAAKAVRATDGTPDGPADDKPPAVSSTVPKSASAAQAGDSDTPPEPSIQSSTDAVEDSLPRSITSSKPPATDLKSLRARAWTLATRLAQRNGIADLVAPLSDKGLGFILRDVPDPSLADQLDADTLGQVSMLWWHLAACAEMTVAPLEAVVATLADDSILRQALDNQDAGLLFNSVWTLDPGHTAYRLWRQLGDQDWQDLLNLMDTYRHIHRAAADTQVRLWG
jgi:ParB family protein of integrating conjugative element (PFGI_1 class)